LVHIFSKMLLSWVIYLFFCWHGFSVVNVMLYDIVYKLFNWCFFHGWNTDWAIRRYMRRISISFTLSFNTLSNAHSCLFSHCNWYYLRRRSCVPASLELCWAELSHATAPKRYTVYVLEFRKKMDEIRNLWLYFIIIVTKYKDYCFLFDGMHATMFNSLIKLKQDD